MSPADLSHDELEELIAADALDGLDELGRRRMHQQMAEHGESCQECGRLVAEYGEAAARLALEVDPEPLSTGAEERLISMARRDAPVATRGRWGRAERWLAVAAAVLLLAVASGVIGHVLGARNSGDVRVLTLRSSAGAPAVSVAYAVGSGRGWVIASSLGPPPDGKVYELWFQPSPGAPMSPAGTFVPRGGAVAAPVTLAKAFVALAVSVEPRGGSRQPTSPPVYFATV